LALIQEKDITPESMRPILHYANKWARGIIAGSLLVLGLAADCLHASASETDPAVLGRKAANNVLGPKSGYAKISSLFLGQIDISYPMACSRYGILILADALHDKDLRDRVAKSYEPFLSGKRKPGKGHVDFNVFGIGPFELYRQTGNPAYLSLAKELADDEFKKAGKDGLADYTRFWVDDMYMVGSLQVQAYKATDDPKYLDRAFRQLLAYRGRLQQPNGLFYHTPEAPFFWGRGNGWAAASMTELLLAAPEDHPQRPALLQAYREMMKGLLAYQDRNGLWRQLIDEPESYLETSSSGMFIFALATGVRKGWLPQEPYRTASLKGWQALSAELDADGNVRDVCIGTGALNNKTHYLMRPRKTGDLHGQAAFLWAATAVYLLNGPGR